MNDEKELNDEAIREVVGGCVSREQSEKFRDRWLASLSPEDRRRAMQSPSSKHPRPRIISRVNGRLIPTDDGRRY